MIRRVAAIAAVEMRILLRNRWVAMAVLLMSAFSLLIAFAGSAPAGTLGVDRMTITAASLSTLAVYLVPLIALLMSYDAFAGECERGTLPLLLTYPVRRSEILAGKFCAQIVVLLGAIAIGFAIAAAAVVLMAGAPGAGLVHLVRLGWTAVLLGAGFLAIGNLISTATRSPGTAAALAIGVWIFAVVMYDVALLAAIVSDAGGAFTENVFPWLLVGSPTDAFRLFNLAQIEANAVAGGVATASKAAAIPPYLAVLSLLAWPAAALACTATLLRRYRP